MKREGEVYITMVYMIKEMLSLVQFVYKWCCKPDTQMVSENICSITSTAPCFIDAVAIIVRSLSCQYIINQYCGGKGFSLNVSALGLF